MADYIHPDQPRMTLEEFLRRYRPYPNKLRDPDLTDYTIGDRQIAFGFTGNERTKINSVNASNTDHLWTMSRQPGRLVITPGFHLFDAVGFLVTLYRVDKPDLVVECDPWIDTLGSEYWTPTRRQSQQAAHA